jgi:hypothetical protein
MRRGPAAPSFSASHPLPAFGRDLEAVIPLISPLSQPAEAEQSDVKEDELTASVESAGDFRFLSHRDLARFFSIAGRGRKLRTEICGDATELAQLGLTLKYSAHFTQRIQQDLAFVMHRPFFNPRHWVSSGTILRREQELPIIPIQIETVPISEEESTRTTAPFPYLRLEDVLQRMLLVPEIVDEMWELRYPKIFWREREAKTANAGEFQSSFLFRCHPFAPLFYVKNPAGEEVCCAVMLVLTVVCFQFHMGENVWIKDAARSIDGPARLCGSYKSVRPPPYVVQDMMSIQLYRTEAEVCAGGLIPAVAATQAGKRLEVHGGLPSLVDELVEEQAEEEDEQAELD